MFGSKDLELGRGFVELSFKVEKDLLGVSELEFGDFGV